MGRAGNAGAARIPQVMNFSRYPQTPRMDQAPWGSVRATRLEQVGGSNSPCRLTKRFPFRCFKTSRLAVIIYVWFSPPLRNVEDLLHKRGIDIGHKPLLAQVS